MYSLPKWNPNLTGSPVFYLVTLPVMGRFGPFHSLFLKCLLKNTLAFTSVWESQASRWTSTLPWKTTFTVHLSSQVGAERPTLGHILVRTHQLHLLSTPALLCATALHSVPPSRPSRPAGWTRRRTTAWQWLTSPRIGSWAEPIRFLESPENFD